MRQTDLATAQQLAALIVEGSDSFPGPRFEIRQIGRAWQLAVRHGEEYRVQSSTRNVAAPRDYKTIEAALNTAQLISRMAGLEADHAWTGEASRLGVMPEVNIVLLNAIQPEAT